ncbi:hypothetical protein IMSHALPRED_006652 [Imshaugia aleurites]|uniref:Uncharacterized protein n=1 Tax=Imshaugia aleurites TaxID=172621 RepID=A0A8H3EJL9_9LECA|nr:hypothetical protein IMSHALPRED_006652 [Imshaugia aleurites]
MSLERETQTPELAKEGVMDAKDEYDEEVEAGEEMSVDGKGENADRLRETDYEQCGTSKMSESSKILSETVASISLPVDSSVTIATNLYGGAFEHGELFKKRPTCPMLFVVQKGAKRGGAPGTGRGSPYESSQGNQDKEKRAKKVADLKAQRPICAY